MINMTGTNKLSKLKQRIGLVTPYKGQVRLLRTKLELFLEEFDCERRDLNINSVDAFQG
jgi:superfamily I DNA and/or RNA helicase